LSGSPDNLPDPNIIPESDSPGSSASDEASAAGGPDISTGPTSGQETPLPDFEPEVPELFDAAAKRSSASPVDLDNFLTSQREGEEVQAPAPGANPTYRVSPAEADLAGHILPVEDSEAEEEDAASTWQTVWAITREVGETIILTLVIFFLIQLVIRNFRVVGTSMVNNLHDGQYLIIDKVSYNPFLIDTLGFGGPARGDVIVFKPPRNPGDDYVKRVIGLPGEKIQVIKGQVFVNDQLLEEPFQPLPGSYTMPAPVIVPENQVFVLGDNRNNSNDSHNWGPLPIDNIVGRAWLSYWPPDQWGSIPRDTPTEEATLMRYLNQLIPSANAHNE